MAQRQKLLLFGFFFVFFLLFPACGRQPEISYKAVIRQTFHSLDFIRKKEQKSILRILAKIRDSAESASGDKKLSSAFFALQDGNPGPAADLDIYFLFNYSLFYDMLFIDSSGEIFFTVKKENDLHKNIFTSELSRTGLAHTLKTNPLSSYSDFEFYPPSEDYAAFFSFPLYRNGDLSGWIVLQCPVKRLNILLEKQNTFGITGDSYLVNEHDILITSSRFNPLARVMPEQTDFHIVDSYLSIGENNAFVTNFRGKNVLCSFDKIEFLGSFWYLIVEIGEREVLTSLFRKNMDYFLKNLPLEFPGVLLSEKQIISKKAYDSCRVNMAEYRIQPEPGIILYTKGVEYCTGFYIHNPMPQGYLAHISPVDRSYISKPVVLWFLRDEITDVVQNVLNFQERHFHSLHPDQRAFFYIIANHKKSIRNILKYLFERDYMLDSIRFLYFPEAHSINVYALPEEGKLEVEWNSGKRKLYSEGEDMPVLLDILRDFLLQ